MKKENVIALFVIGSVLLFSLIGMSIVSFEVSGLNITNGTVLARVNVWNTEPVIQLVRINPDPIDLTPGNITYVNCTAYVYDYNGWQDIVFVNSTFFHETSDDQASDDDNDHYTNSTCNCAQQDSSSTNATCVCTYPINYFAYNGSWTCNFTIRDKGGWAYNNQSSRLFNNTRTNYTKVNISEMIAIETPTELDYGNLSVTEISGNKTINITNFGNIGLNISVRGWAGGEESAPGAQNWTMFCELGNISYGYQRYSVDPDTNFANKFNLTNTSKYLSLPEIGLPARINDTTFQQDRNMTYWQIEIPLTVGGTCNGTIEFTAQKLE